MTGAWNIAKTLCSLLAFAAAAPVYAQVAFPLPSSIQERPRDTPKLRIVPDDIGTSERQRILGTELKMPGFGLEASSAQLEKRLKYAHEHKWAEDAELEPIDTGVRTAIEQEKLIGTDPSHQVAYTRRKLSQQIFKLNEQFEEIVLGPAMSVSGAVLWKKSESKDDDKSDESAPATEGNNTEKPAGAAPESTSAQ